MKRRLVCAALLTAAACAEGDATRRATAPTVATPTKATHVVLAAQAGGFVSAQDERGVPSFVWATDERVPTDDVTAEIAARRYLTRFAPALGVSKRDVRVAELRAVHELEGIGVVAQFSQRADGIEIYPSEVRVLMRANLSLVAMSGSLRSASVASKGAPFRLDEADAVALAIADVTGTPLSTEAIVGASEPRGDFLYFDLLEGTDVVLPQPARAKPIYFAPDNKAAPAYFVEFYAGRSGENESSAYRYIVSAEDGRVLDRRDLTHTDPFSYRVHADTTGNNRPLAGPHEDFQPHPTGVPDGTVPALIDAPLITIEGFNTNPQGGVDPWLSSTAVDTRGNNVDAYADDNAPDGFSNGDVRATLTSSRTFDRVYDPTLDPAENETQIMASVAEIFYVTNWLHDYWYDSGFNEAAGNAQLDNFGRGGVDGDPLRAEAQDGHASGRRNNANMSTPSDGMSPRMQMYAWRGSDTRTLVVSSNVNPLDTGAASFGPSTFNASGSVVLVNDNDGTTSDGCEAIQNNVAGSVALVDRGGCSFWSKIANAESAGAIAVILANNRAGNAPTMGGTPGLPINIGALSITEAEGIALKAALTGGPVTATLTRVTGTDRDGSFDHGVVSHEWGHYIHNRLTDCGSSQCRGIGEGWGDFIALHTQLREGDDLDGVYPRSIWARLSLPNGAYFGGRRVPYSTNPAANEMRFRHIANGEPLPTHPIEARNENAEVHNTGEVWTSMMFEVYVALLRQTVGPLPGPTFAEMRRRMTDYIVAGMMLTPRDSTFVDARDGILAAAYAANANDFTAMAEAFAIRGMGSCAIAPPRYSTDNLGVVESYELKPRTVMTQISWSDDQRSCDGDGVLDAEEQGTLTIGIANAGAAPLDNAQVIVASATPGVGFPNGNQFSTGTIPPLSSGEVTLPIALDGTVTASTALVLNVRVVDPNGCETTVTSTVISRINFDNTQSSTRDDVESSTTAWTIDGNFGTDIWAREGDARSGYAWRGIDFGSPSDTWIVTPRLDVSAAASFVVSFSHRYRFEAEADDGTGTNWDGGVIEISRDDGATWIDTSSIADPGYRGTLTDRSSNPLALRDALVGTSTAWPDRQRVRLDYGSAFAGEQVRFRFRIGTDQASSDFGWEIDDLDFAGIDNAPFFALDDDQTICPEALTADAGPDQLVLPVAEVVLDGTNSQSAFNRPLTYTWTQSAGPGVLLMPNADGIVAFTAPSPNVETTLTFTLTVDDGVGSATDTVDIVVGATDAPVANAGPDQSVGSGALVTLDGSMSTGFGLTFSWTSSQITLTDPTAARPMFTAPMPDETTTFTFELTVDDGTQTDTDTVEITVAGVDALIANAGADQTVDAGTSVVLDGSQSTGADGQTLTYAWVQTDGASLALNAADQVVASFDAPSSDTATTYTFELTVSDGSQTATDTVAISVNAAEKSAPIEEDGGCSCTTAEHRPTGAGWLLLIGLVLAFLSRRSQSGRHQPMPSSVFRI